MNSTSRSRTRMQRICYNVHAALWAVAAAFLLVMASNLPRMSEARATAERQRALEISEENRFYCEKWGMKAGTHEHTLCILDLQDIRAKVEQRIDDDMAF